MSFIEKENVLGKIVSSVFKVLNALDVSKKIRQKNSLKYLPWSCAWAEVKKIYPDANFHIERQVIDERGTKRPWFDDGKTGWVEVGVTIEGLEHKCVLPIMDFKNKSIPAEEITSMDANKAIQRCLTKACGLHGLGLYIYEGEDVPEDVAIILELQEECTNLVAKKCSLSDKAKLKVEELCKAAEKKFSPELSEELIRGNPKKIEDVDILTELKKQLMGVRK